MAKAKPGCAHCLWVIFNIGGEITGRGQSPRPFLFAMTITYPSFEEFARKAREGNLIPVYQEVLADVETPVSALLKASSRAYPFLLESVEGGEKWGRFSFLGFDPRAVFRSKGDRVEIIEGGKKRIKKVSGDPFQELKALMSRYRPVPVEGLPRFIGGAVGYAGYDTVRFFEKLPVEAEDDLKVWDTFFTIADTLLIFDNMTHRLRIVSNAFVENQKDALKSYKQAKGKIREIVRMLETPIHLPSIRKPKKIAFSSTHSSNEFQGMVRKAKEYIRNGDIIQVVLSQRFSVKNAVDPMQVYRALRAINPSPYMFYLGFDGITLVGSSPEVLVRLEGNTIELRPIAGTRPRGKTHNEDMSLERELLYDHKEKAEHIMLVDLGRNDVGRVARPGTVKVNDLMAVERYSHVMHIVSNVVGTLEPGKDCFNVLRAAFPAGTVTGAPKIRAMEIIEELEKIRRGPYAGAVGYFSFSGNMDMGIVIRTILFKGRTIHIQAGAGIVADSDPKREYEETVNKASGMIAAVNRAVQGL